ncbi:OmpA family protein [Noviherbaspirillum massiliense]|uniref:OmpA family protein n=1 Tax=Noviherbaspirillum massiliense TaxID=1465823 RepID=UPI0002FC4053|nr:OmpA family protein [Noviherbaspirillum massiliense]
MKLRPHSIAIAVSLLLNGLAGPAGADDGQRIDHARADRKPIPASAEAEPAEGFPLPSGVSREEAAWMAAAMAQLPAGDAGLSRSLADRGGRNLFVSGRAELTPASKEVLDALVADIKSLNASSRLRLAVIGHTDNQRLSAASKRIFRDNDGLSAMRALAVAGYLKQALDLSAEAIAIEGRGEREPVAPNDTAANMARNRRVDVRIWFEAEASNQQVPEAPVPAPSVAESCSPYGGIAVPFRITVDGEPLDAGERVNEADRQRCADVALERADIQVRYDSLSMTPAMNVWATPDAAVKGEPVEFRAWSNYIPFITKAELRLFRPGQKPQETPLAIEPLSWAAPLAWTAPLNDADSEVYYLLRVYDAQGRFDETSLKRLNLLEHVRSASDRDRIERERLTGYGENSLALRNIPVAGGTVTVNGSHLQAGQTVEALGLQLPVDAQGKFAIKQIMSAGTHTVEVSVKDKDGRTTTFRRNLSIAADDWFYVAVGDLTLGRNDVAGPARLVTGDAQHYEDKVYVDGRAAFYLKGKVKGEWLLTAAADTRDGPVKDLFSNFSSKDPRYLLRNIDPDLYYPVYGDDSTTVDDAPTQGKFYVRLQKGDSHVMWGNFQTSWSGTELLQYSRGLYGAQMRHRSDEATTYGEKRTQVDAFAADPGTLSARDEFRGTGGSLYYLRHLDITQGSERVWIEVRDKDSGLVVERKELMPAQDYDINYLQGRVLLRGALASTGAGSGLVMTSPVNGNPVYLVTTYEYVPGLSAVDNLSSGVRASQWLNDHVQIGVSGYHQGEQGSSQTLKGVDGTLRYKPGTWVKFEAAHSAGPGTGTLTSQDGGFNFNGLTAGGQDANARRVEAAVDLAEISDGMNGKLAGYAQDRERGYSGPGQIGFNGEAVNQQGVKADVEVRQGTVLSGKADRRNGETQDSQAAEVALRQDLTREWQASVGVRRDERSNVIANASPTLSQIGARTDSQIRLDYKPDDGGKPGAKKDWEAYSFVQGTLAHDDTRELNNRAGLGGGWQASERVRLNAEASGGSLGPGGKLGADYRVSDRSNAYLNYVLESESPDVAWRGRQGTWVSGASTRVSDQVRIFGEARATAGDGPQSLSQAFGTDWAPNDRWNYGAKAEFGTVSDPLAGDLKRRALGTSIGYKQGGIRYGGNLEWRRDVGNVSGERTTWLLRNAAGLQVDPSLRLLGKLNVSRSSNSDGAFVDGEYHEYVLGAAYRPVDNDRWNTLFKYTNLHNVPTTGQLGASGTLADYAQRSQVFAVDTIYDLTPWLSVGGKYAVRIGELKATMVDGEWFSSRADLWILRADWHWVKEWDALVELRKLRATEAQDARAGALAGIYRHVANGVKLGAGYNFTNYSDDLTDLSYRSRGWFVNVLGTY